MKTKYTKENLEKLVEESLTVSDVLRKLNLKARGGNHQHITRMIKYYNIDTSHFKGRGWSKDKDLPILQMPIEKYLSNEIHISSHRLREKLFKHNYFEKKCYSCGLSKWLDQEIPLELHHIDNDHYNNSLNNLTIICPNCHAVEHHKSRR